jgi:taurine dioxygenase
VWNSDGGITERTPMTTTSLTHRTSPITPRFGAEIVDGRLRDADPAWLLSLLEEHVVVVARDQNLTRPEHVALAKSLGETTPAHPVVPGDGEFPEILDLDAANGGRNARWHTDVTFVPVPPAVSILVGDVIPPTGGDTLWADLRAGYDTLAAPIRDLVDDLQAVHRISPLAYWGEPFDTGLSRTDAQHLLDKALTVPPVIHPVVRVHPSTGRRVLFVNPGFTTHIVGLSRIESDSILQLLYEHTARPEHVLRHRWQPGDVVMWDNRATMHYAIDDYGNSPRRMRRVTLKGTVPTGPSGFTSHVVTDPLLAVR